MKRWVKELLCKHVWYTEGYIEHIGSVVVDRGCSRICQKCERPEMIAVDADNSGAFRWVRDGGPPMTTGTGKSLIKVLVLLTGCAFVLGVLAGVTIGATWL